MNCFPWRHKKREQKPPELPLEENDTETKNATQIWLPLELWGYLILHYLKTDDVQAFCTAFPQFSGMMHKTRHLWMIDKVLDSVWSYLTKTDILKMRLICWRWCTGVDRTIDNIAISSGRQNIPLLINQFTVDCNEKFNKFPIDQHILSPRIFLAKRAKICIGQNSNLKYSELITLIAKVGIQVHHIHIDISSPMFATLLVLLQHLFRHCPNLRSLELKETFEPRMLAQQQSSRDLSWPFEQIITLWPKSLQYFACHLQNGSPLQCLQELGVMRLCGIEIRRSAKQVLKPAVVWSQANNLGFHFTVKSRKTLRSVFPLKLTDLPLTRISFQHTYAAPRKSTWNTWYVYKFVKKFKKTLVHLTIDMMVATPRRLQDFFDKPPYSQDLPYFNLPVLETLVLRCFPAYHFDSLIYLKSLRYLSIDFGDDITWNQSFRWEYSVKEDIRRYLHNQTINVHLPYHMYLWKRFPRLLELVHENRQLGRIRRFRRDEYEKLKGKSLCEVCRAARRVV